jgi:hypothetical protein
MSYTRGYPCCDGSDVLRALELGSVGGENGELSDLFIGGEVRQWCRKNLPGCSVLAPCLSLRLAGSMRQLEEGTAGACAHLPQLRDRRRRGCSSRPRRPGLEFCMRWRRYAARRRAGIFRAAVDARKKTCSTWCPRGACPGWAIAVKISCQEPWRSASGTTEQVQVHKHNEGKEFWTGVHAEEKVSLLVDLGPRGLGKGK